jgi:pyruvate dehydrogenase E2 component (dihydrolipoamide acetyltransferase)
MAQFNLPEIGEGVIEGEIVRWLKQPGDSIASNEALIEIMTDKATIEIPSPLAGVVTSHQAAEGDICEVGAPLCVIDEAGSAAPAPAPTAVAAPAASASSSASSVPATPAARALAREKGIDLGSLPVDERGRITKSDVMAAGTPAAAPAPQAARAAAPAPKAAPAAAPPIQTMPRTATPEPIPEPVARRAVSREDEHIPFRGMRRIIAEGMARSYSTAVHYTYVEQINVTKLVKLRKEAKEVAKEQGVSLSYLPFIVKAICHALKKFPIVNATLDEANARVTLRKRYHIGMAAATDQGLMVPVIKDADQLSLLDIGREIARLGAAAKQGKVARDELTGSTFTITSLGNIGGVLATPIINFPEVGILGVHAIRKTAIVNENDEIVVGHLMNLSCSFDHRVVDGYEGASFLQEVRRYLEDPNLLLLASI